MHKVFPDPDLEPFPKYILNLLIERATTHYTCNRGPRPSGAMLGTNSGHTFYGDVVPPEGSPSCKDDGCMIEDGHCVRCNHAEVHAILKAARSGTITGGGTMYSINKPCYQCTRTIIAAGIKKIYYAYAVYDEERTRQILELAHVDCEQVVLDENPG